ncbi:MAG: zinc ABC transporter substrate-binding protein [Pseudomonadota bacterium]
MSKYALPILRTLAITTALACSTSLGASIAQADQAPNVVVTIKPVHSLASAIMEGVGEPVLLLDGAASPHSYSLRPSEARSLNEANLVIYVADNLESFLEKPLQSLAGKAHQLELIDVLGMHVLAVRAGGAWETHSHGDDDHDHEHGDHAEHEHDDHDEEDHDHDHEGHDHEEHGDHDEHDHDHAGQNDPHLWLDIHNGETIARAIAAELTEIDMAHAAQYETNLQALLAKLETLEGDLQKRLDSVKDLPFVVFHDAYQYLEHGFGLTAVGSITVSPEQTPGVQRLHEIEDKIKSTGAQCVFAEPQFRPAIVDAVVADTGARSGILDPLGANIPAGPDAYGAILSQNVDALVGCLSGS